MKDGNEKILLLPLEKILPNRFQPRIKFSEESILDLADSIKTHGVIQPIIVRTIGDKYEIVAGERRYKASALAGIKEIPALLYDINDKESAELALIENVQRKDLSPIEQAISFKKILDMGYLTQSELASKIGISQSALANKIRLLNLSDDVQEALLDEKISERHARSLLKISNSDDQVKMLKRIISKKLTVRALDEEIKYYDEHGEFKENKEESPKAEIISSPVLEIKNEKTEDKDETKANEENTLVEHKEEELSEEKNQSDVEISSEQNDDDSKKEEVSSNDEKTEDKEEQSTQEEIINTEQDENDKKEIEESKEDENSNEEKSSEKNKEQLEESENNIKDIDSTSLEEKIKQIKEELNNEGENDYSMNNFNDNYEDINYNTLKTNNSEHGKFLINNDDDEKKENNSEQIFNFGISSNTNEESNDLLKNLMAPQGSKNIFEIGSNESVIPTNVTSAPTVPEENTNSNTTTSQETSMFSNLLNSQQQDADSVDDDTLNKFLDPSYVDGEKQNVNMDNENKNSSIFSKFINAQSSNEDDTKVETEQNNNSNSIFNFSNVDKADTANIDTSENKSIFNFSNNGSTTVEPPSIFSGLTNTNNNNQQSSIFSGVTTPQTTQTEAVNESSVDTPTESAPSSEIVPEIPDTTNITNNIESIFDNSKANKPDLLAPMGEEQKTEESSQETNVFGMSTSNPVIETNNLLQPQENVETKGISLSQFNTVPSSSIEESVEESTEESVDKISDEAKVENEEVKEEPKEEESPISFNTTSPIFITASSNSNVSTMPSTPIIELKDDNNDSTVVEEEQNTEEIEEKEVDESNEPTVEVPNIIGNQPIIVTDYNKQYDPVLPETSQKFERIEFKKILELIRELSDTIEKCGYEIDTDEIDLQDKYQVIFNINKE